MGHLTKEQKKKLDSLVKDHNFFSKIDKLLKDYGAGDLRLTSLNVQPKDNGSTTMTGTTAGPLLQDLSDFTIFPPLCKHGIPMIERCTVGGSCKWVCNHS